MPGICIPTDIPRITEPAFLSSPCCYVVNGWDLTTGADVRGASDLIPTIPGRRSNEWREDETNHELQIIMVGDVDSAGADRGVGGGEGLELTLNELRFFVVSPGIVESTWELTMPSGTVRTAGVQVKRLKAGVVVEAPDWTGVVGMAMTATMSILIPSGGFV